MNSTAAPQMLRRRIVQKLKTMRSSPGGQILADLLTTLSARIRYAA